MSNKISKPYQYELLKALTDPVEAAEYLNAALDEGSNELFLIALRNVAEAQKLKKITENHINEKEIAHVTDTDTFDLSNLSEILASIELRFAVASK